MSLSALLESELLARVTLAGVTFKGLGEERMSISGTPLCRESLRFSRDGVTECPRSISSGDSVAAVAAVVVRDKRGRRADVEV